MAKKTVVKKAVSKKVTVKKEDKLVKVKVGLDFNKINDALSFSNSGKEVEIKESLKKKIDKAFADYKKAQEELEKLYLEL